MLFAMYKYLLLCLCFLACRKSTTNNSNPLLLKLSECANLQRASGNLKVCLDSISDARCPANAFCIWEGYAVAKLTVSAANTVHSFRLSTTKRQGFPPNDTTVANHRFQLVNVQPYPGTGGNVTPHIELLVD